MTLRMIPPTVSAPSTPPVFTGGGRHWTRQDTVRAVVAGVALVGSGAAAAHGLSPFERLVYDAVYAVPSAIYPVVWPVMQIGSLGGGLALAAAMGVGTRRWSVGAFGLAAVGSSWVVAKAIKALVKRGRPTEFELVTAFDRGAPDGGLGFVSGHTTVAFALYAMAVPHLSRRYRVPALVLASLVGLSRIYVGAHLPLDVVGGAALGTLTGEAFRWTETRWRSGRLPGVSAEDPVPT